VDFRVKVGREEHQYLAKNTAQAEFAVLVFYAVSAELLD
jgi:hypothetical protein